MTERPAERWRSASVSRAASPGGGSTASDGLPLGVVVAEGGDELVDLAERLPRDLLDRLQRLAGAIEVVLLLEEPRRPGLDEDHVDRVPGRVVQVARDARALLGGGEAPLALGLALGAEGSLLELGDPGPPLAHAVADHPCPAPDEGAEEERDGRELVFRETGCAGVDRVEPDHDEAGQPPRRARPLGTQGEEEQRHGRTEREAGWVAESVQYGARGGGQGEDGERRPAPSDERQRSERREQHAERIEVARVRLGRAARGEHRE